MKKIISGIILFTSLITSASAENMSFKTHYDKTIEYNTKNSIISEIKEENLLKTAETSSGTYYQENVDYLKNVKWVKGYSSKKSIINGFNFYQDFYFKPKNSDKIYQITNFEKEDENFVYLIYKKITLGKKSGILGENRIKEIEENINNNKYYYYNLGEFVFFTDQNNEIIVINTNTSEIFSIGYSYELRKKASTYEYLSKNLTEINISENDKNLQKINIFTLNTNETYILNERYPIFKNKENGKFYISSKNENALKCKELDKRFEKENKNIFQNEDDIDEELMNFVKCIGTDLDDEISFLESDFY